ncbi:MAG: DUF3891 family protein [Actinobacteria bacterium]|nr:DUF3891 family protein [Actinomycetota bacterium]
MIVRPTGDTAEVVTQVDHAVVSGILAEAWAADGPDALAPRAAIVTAARLHDIGWRHWETAPRLNPDTGRPANFLDVVIDEHLRLYRLGIEEVETADPWAGMLVSMHAAGIYTGRYGTQPALLLSRAPDVQAVVDAFVAEQEAHYGGAKVALGVTDDELWRAYVLLQVFDRLSLRLCQGDPAGPGPMEIALPGERVLRVEPDAGCDRLDPWPFAADEIRVGIPTRTVPLAGYDGDDALGAALAAAASEERTAVLRPA